MTALSINVNKFALIRNARGADMPNLVDISKKCIEYGADGITVHPRPDERHVKFSDLQELKNLTSFYFLTLEQNDNHQKFFSQICFQKLL